MSTSGRTYRLTEMGQAVSAGDDLSVPADYRRILALITADTHFDVIRGALRRYPDKLIGEWVEELEEIGYLEAVPSEADFDLDFTKMATEFRMPGVDMEGVLASQRRRRLVGQALSRGKLTSWDHQPMVKASEQYMRNHMDLDDLERRARCPGV